MGAETNRASGQRKVSAKVRREAEVNVAVPVIDNPPVNTGSWEVRSGLLAAIRAAPSLAAMPINPGIDVMRQ
jgi:hypothetical protein